jgi:hypothetical protein
MQFFCWNAEKVLWLSLGISKSSKISWKGTASALFLKTKPVYGS